MFDSMSSGVLLFSSCTISARYESRASSRIVWKISHSTFSRSFLPSYPLPSTQWTLQNHQQLMQQSLNTAYNVSVIRLHPHYLPTVILIVILKEWVGDGIPVITGIPSPTHSFTLGLNPSFSANPPYRTLSFLSFRFHYMDFPDCLLLLLSISVFLLFSFFLFLHFFSCRFRVVD